MGPMQPSRQQQPQQPQQQQQQQQQQQHQQQQQQIVGPFGYDLNLNAVDASLVGPCPEIDHFDLGSSTDSNNTDQVHSEELLTQRDREHLGSFFSQFANDSAFDFGSRSYGEGVGIFPSDFQQWMTPDSIVSHQVTYPGDSLDAMLQATYSGLSHASLPGMTQYSVQPQHIFTDIGNQPPQFAAIPPGSQPRTTQASPQSGLSFDANNLHDIPILPSRPQHQTAGYGESVDPSRPFHHHTAFALPAASSFTRQQRPTRPPPGIHFGSDPNFNNRDFYVPSSAKETTEHIAATQLATLSCLERNPSAAPTRAPSPVLATVSEHIPETIVEQTDGKADRRPIKRRKSSKPDEEHRSPTYATSISSNIVTQEEEPPSPSTLTSPRSTPSSATTTKKRRSTIITSPTDSVPSPVATKRKRVPAALAKPPRENLTMEQKRHNHILSEQRRRNAIKNGFDELMRVVPALRGGGCSKAVSLVHTADFVVKLQQGNQELKSLLLKHKKNGGNLNGGVGADAAKDDSVSPSSSP